MTQAEKAKRYDEAIINGLRLWECGLITREAYENIFPELRNEDEEIRQGLIGLVKQSSEILEKKNQEQMIAWLEKQDKNRYIFKSIPRLLEMIKPTDRAKSYCQKLIDSLLQEGYITDAKIVSNCLKQMNGETVAMATMDEKPVEEHEPDKVEPTFHDGDWAKFCEGKPFKIIKIEKEINGVLDYLLLNQNGQASYFSKNYVDENARLWTIDDAKGGDVLAASDDGMIILVKESRSSSWGYRLSYYCAVLRDGTFEPREFHANPEKFFPATKEQRDLLFQKMNEAGYEWDAERKELKRI